MTQAAFKTNPISLEQLLKDCASGKIQLPDFQRSWVWDEDRIKSLISSISEAFPVGALMTLEMRAGVADTFARRPVQGASDIASSTSPDQLLLDGQQRMTSLYQACMRKEVVETVTSRQKLVTRWFYIDIEKALMPGVDREEAVLSIPEDRKIKEDFNRKIVLDLSTPETEYQKLMFPLNQVFDWDAWQDGFWEFWRKRGESEKTVVFKKFKDEVLQHFKSYQVPVIALGHDTSHEAVCIVFEKVNTGGKPLDAFELVTAMYAAKGYRLREDWYGSSTSPGLHGRLQSFGHAAGRKYGVLEKIASTDFLQAIALLHTKNVRQDAIAAGSKESDLPAVRATRQSLLDLPLDAYIKYKDRVEQGFETAVKFLRQQFIFRAIDLPYQTQIVPLAAILAEIGEQWEHTESKRKLARWFWCGIFGELYGSAVESRFAKDIVEVPAWLAGGAEPTTVVSGILRGDRLRSMRTRLSAAYKGIHALLMQEGATDFRTGQPFNQTVFFDEDVDIHHIFPQAWCRQQGLEPAIYDSVINKTPLSYRTNRKIGGVAPSVYLQRLEAGQNDDPPISRSTMDEYLRTHCVDPMLLRGDAFENFMNDREERLLKLIARVTGHEIAAAGEPLDERDVPDDIAEDSGLLASSAG